MKDDIIVKIGMSWYHTTHDQTYHCTRVTPGTIYYTDDVLEADVDKFRQPIAMWRQSIKEGLTTLIEEKLNE